MKKQIRKKLDALGLAMGIAGAASSTQAAGLYTDGHGDIRMSYSSGAFSLFYQLNDDALVDGAEAGTYGSGSGQFAPNAIIPYIPDPPYPSRPEGAEWDFVGTPAGQPLWYIPFSQEPDRPWLGFSTESLSFGDWLSPIQVSLVGMNGPANSHVTLLQWGPVGEPYVDFATYDGIDSTDLVEWSTGSHVHYEWLFTQPGLYDLSFKVSGEHVTDGFQEMTATFTLGVAAVPEPGVVPLLGIGILALLIQFRRISQTPSHP